MDRRVREFYKGKRVLLTGHTGFKGTWMSLMLEQLGAIVCGYSLPIEPDSFYVKVKPLTNTHIEGDIADAEHVLQSVKDFQPEIVFHFASHSSLDGCMTIPDYILRTNLMGVVNVLEATRKTDSVKAVIIVTSDKCYANLETDIPYKEDSLLDAVEPYSTSKVCQELLTKCYRETFYSGTDKRVGIASARASNVIGVGDYNKTRLIPYLLDSFSEGRKPQIRNLQAIRPWQYVLDVLEGYLILGEKLYSSLGTEESFDGPYNFGADESGFVTVETIVKMFADAFGKYDETLKQEIEIVSDGSPINNETKILKLDSTKAHNILGWNCRIGLSEAVDRIVLLFMQEKQGNDAKELYRNHVKRYVLSNE